jgi:hypothetical protein
MSFGITSAAKAANYAILHIWELANDAPRIELVFVGHDALLVIAR